MQKNSNHRHLYVFLVPIVFCAIFSAILYFAETRIEQDQNEIRERNWINHAKFYSNQVRNSFSISLQIQMALQNLNDDLAKTTWISEKQPGPYFAELLKRRLPEQNFKTAQIWAFTQTKDKVKLIKANGIKSLRKRAMEMAFSNLCEIADNWENPNSESLKKTEKFLTGIFGFNSAPRYLAGTREGLITPVKFSGKDSYVIWKSFKKNNDRTGGIIAIFPEKFIDNHKTGLSNLANNSLNRQKNTFGTAFFLSKEVSEKFTPIIPEKLSLNKNEKSQVLKLIRKYWKKEDNKFLRKPLKEQNFWLYIDYISLESPYLSVIISKNLEKKPLWVKPSKVFLGIPLIWMIFFLYKMRSPRSSILNLGLSFRLLFFFIGTLPISLMLYMGSTQILQSKQIKTTEKINSFFQKMNSISEKFETLIPKVQQILSKTIKSRNFQTLCNSNKMVDYEAASKILLEKVKKENFALTFMFLIKPGKKAFAKTFRKEDEKAVSTKLDYYLIATNALHEALSKNEPDYKKIKLTRDQKKLKKTFNQEYFDSAMNTFLTSLEDISTVQFSNTDRFYYYTHFIHNKNTITAYAVVGINMEDISKKFLNSEFLDLNKSADGTFFAVQKSKTGAFTPIPAQSQNFSNSLSGQKLKKFVQSNLNSSSQMHLTEKNQVFLLAPLQKLKNYIACGSISIADIEKMTNLRFIFLLILISILVAINTFLSASISHIMIEPLTELTDVFKRVTAMDFETTFQYPYKNELGNLATSTKNMISGLKERQALGKFVSTTLNKNAGFEENFKEARSLEGVVLFSDIRSFTTLSESHPPSDIAKMLNTHLAEMVEIIVSNKGQVEQFIGDAIVAFFPANNPESIDSSINVAREMMKRHLEIQADRKSSNLFNYEIGIGMDYGMVMAGILSTSTRSEFTIIGPARYQAERLESESRYGKQTRIMVSANVLSSTSLKTGFIEVKSEENNPHFELVSLDDCL